jgi:hypothetical protein
MSGAVTRFLGDSPLRVLIKLVVVSFLVGIVMAAFDWTPVDVFYRVIDFFHEVWLLGFSTFDRFAGYFLLGAAIVVPAFIILRLFSLRR